MEEVDHLLKKVKTLPLYAYRCTQCGYKFEKIQHFSATPESECPKCQGVLERPLTAPVFHFKGSGFYVNDYAAKSPAPASEYSSDSAAKTESGTSGSNASSSDTPATAPAAPAPPPASSASTPTG